VRRVVTAGLVITTAALAAVCAIILFGDVVPLFTGDHEVAGLVTGLLPVLVPVVLADGLQAVLGFGLAGLKRTTPSFVVFASCYGLLAVFAFAAPNLTVLWAALALANLAVGVGQALAFRRASNL
jgi:multidrug resistance protein, MATE family